VALNDVDVELDVEFLMWSFQGWLRWQEQLLISQRDRRKEATAVQHYQHWQKQRSLKAWLKYLQICRVKRWQNGESEA
jgi:hypothetical protein